MIVFCFVLVSLVITGLITAGSFVLWQAVLVFLGCFLAVNVLYVFAAFSTSALVDNTKPIEKEKPVCRVAAISVFEMVCSYLGLSMRVKGEEKLPKDEKYLVVSNHRSAFDPIVMMYKLRHHKVSFIAKPSVMNLPFIGKIAYGIGCLSIDRDNDRNALKTILTAANYLKNGICNVCIFPEGTRSKTNEMLPFHAGSFKIAQRANAPLVIAAISGTEKIKNNVPLRRTKVLVNILEVIPAEKVKAANTQELADYSRELIAKSLQEDAE